MALIGFGSNLIKAQWFTKLPEPTATFDGQTIIITGANTGLGYAAAEHFTRLNAAKVIIACRTVSKGDAAKTELEKATGRTGVLEVWQLDLANYDSVKAFAARCEKDLDRLDGLVANAGIQTTTFELVNGYESTVSVNVISTFLLAVLVLPKMKESAAKHPGQPPHLVILSSDTHMLVNFPQAKNPEPIFEQLSDKKKVNLMVQYAMSKFLDILATFALVDSLPSEYPVIIDTVNPGLCQSELNRESPGMSKVIKALFKARTSEEGARNHVFAASAGREFHGKYVSECGMGVTSSFFATDEWKEPGKRLWKELSEILEKISPGSIARL